ncbi:hypothetical protein GTP45_10725 [Pseudoduganella sp. FT55W]|uniref:Uncharacterized protein n=1 Tax=Duganella rivi TaxID=2666083 RepID=A0A7X4GRG2_9BURK|nr:hypothetical protein [Duganella rivi]MYM67304.1 hypothetical protein [Duganella rivi]
MNAPIKLTKPEKVEVRAALDGREGAIRKALAVIAADKNPRAYDALKAAYTNSLEMIGAIRNKVRV